MLWVSAGRSRSSGFPPGGAAGFSQPSSQYLTVADNATLSMGAGQDFTLWGWVYLTTLPSVQGKTYTILDKSADNTGTNREYQLAISFGDDRLRFSVGDGSGNVSGSFPSLPLTATTWHFWCARCIAGSELKLWLNTGTTNFTSGVLNAQDGGAALEFGRLTAGVASSGHFMHGREDAVGLAKRALSDADVTALYNSGAGKGYASLTAGEKVGLVSFWDFNDTGDPASWIDSHGTNHLTSTNGVTSVAGII
jgi:hypothetical protein